MCQTKEKPTSQFVAQGKTNKTCETSKRCKRNLSCDHNKQLITLSVITLSSFCCIRTINICNRRDKLFEIVENLSTVETNFLPVSRSRVLIETQSRQIETPRLNQNNQYLLWNVTELICSYSFCESTYTQNVEISTHVHFLTYVSANTYVTEVKN